MPAIPSCVDEQCPTNSLPPKDRQLFCFPRSDDLRRQWLERMERPDLMAFTYSQLHGRRLRVCERHFKTKQFQTSARKKLCTQQIPRLVVNLEDDPDSPINSPSSSSIPCTSSEFETPKPRTYRARTTLREVDSTRSKVTPKEQKLMARLKNAKNILRYRSKRIQHLSQFKKNNANPFSPSNLTNIQHIHTLPKPLRVFILYLVRNFQTTKKNRRYTLEEKALFLSILKHGPRSYRYLQKILCLPSTRTLKRSLANFQLTSGINLNLFTYLKSVSTKMALCDRFCTLMFDEMETEKNLNLKVTENGWHVEGFVEVGTERGQKLSDHVLVFMLRGLAKKWKQPLAFYFTHKAANPHILKSLIKEVIQAVHKHTDFRIVASVCDGGSWNVAALRSLSAECGKEGDQFVYNIDGHQIIHVYDVPHMLKSMRNNLMTKDIVFEGKTAKWSDIHRLFELDGDSGIFKATKLRYVHVNPTHRQKMKVKLAAQVFSNSTASLLNILSKTGVMDAAGTAIFVKFMNDLFDSLNSVFTSSKPLACKLTSSSQHLRFWDDASKKLKTIKFLSSGKCVGNPPTIKLLLATISNVRHLWDFLRDNGFKYLTLKSLNQDPLENLFGVARGLCGGNTKPSPSQFVDAYKTVILNNTGPCGSNMNCEDDGEDFLLSYNILLSNCTPSDPMNPTSSSSVQFSSITTTKSSTNSKSTVSLLEVDLNKSAYVAGYLIKKLINFECQHCNQFFCSDTITDVDDLIELRDNARDANFLLKYPSSTFINIISDMKDKIFRNVPNIIRHPNIFSQISYTDFLQHFCPSHPDISNNICKQLTFLVLRYFINLCNKKLRNSANTAHETVDSFIKIST